MNFNCLPQRRETEKLDKVGGKYGAGAGLLKGKGEAAGTFAI